MERLFVGEPEGSAADVDEPRPTWLHRMRRPCNCGNWEARVVVRSNQQTLFCTACGKYQYNAPKTETRPPS